MAAAFKSAQEADLQSVLAKLSVPDRCMVKIQSQKGVLLVSLMPQILHLSSLLSDMAASLTSAEQADLQNVLAELSIPDRCVMEPQARS